MVLLALLCASACVCTNEGEAYNKYLKTLPNGSAHRFQETSPYWLKQELQYYSGFNLAQYGTLRDRFPHLQELQDYARKRFETEASIYEKSYEELDRIDKLMRENKLSLYRYDIAVRGEKEWGLILLDKHGKVVEKIEGWMP